jgi:hypothetical protein
MVEIGMPSAICRGISRAMNIFGFNTGKNANPVEGQQQLSESIHNVANVEQSIPLFAVNYDKLIQAIHVAASAWPGISHYFLGKALFKADKEHLLDYGRPITGGHYKAYQYGPYAVEAIELVKGEGFVPPEISHELDERIETSQCYKSIIIKPRGDSLYPDLSEEEVDYIRNAVGDVRQKDFRTVANETHEDPAWKEAWEKRPYSVMDIRTWLNELKNPEKASEQLTESVQFWS